MAALAMMVAAPAFAESHEMTLQGDAAAGETAFGRQCVACHVVVDEAGETLAGRSARTGPNLYGVAGGPIGAVEDFRYSDALLALNEQEATWDEESFVGYVQDPTGWLRETLDDGSARGKMAFRVRDEQDAYDIYAFIASLGGAEDDSEEMSE